MRIAKTLMLGILALALAAGCGKSGDTEGEKGGEKKAAATKAGAATAAAKAPAAKEWLKVESYGVQLEVPGGAKAEQGAGTSYMIMSPDGSCTVMLAKKDDMSFFQSYDSTVADMEKEKKEVLVNEKTDDDNWVLHFTKPSLMDETKLQHAVDVRRKVGDGVYSCGRVTDSAEDAACVLAACKSLKGL